MAVICSFSCPIISPLPKFLTQNKHTQIPLRKKKSFLIQARSFNNKVFENKSEGIICYRDESGEIICEGFDEGPRYFQQTLRTTYNLRDSEIVNLLHQRLLQVINEGQLNKQNGAEDPKFNNGFNKFW